ncbi:MAG: extracellular solute-binding protein [Christensenellales bacterium]|jgi:ABC-type glycerol-3-phosphate transport system substrate-binding protein
MKHRANRMLALVMALCLLPLVPLAAEGTKTTNLFGSALMDNLYTPDSIFCVARAGNTLYIRTETALYTYQEGDARAVRRMDMPSMYGIDYFITGNEDKNPPSITYLLGEGDTLYGLDIKQQTLYTVALEGDTLATSNPIKLDMTAFQSGEDERPHMEHPAWIVLHEGTLFMKKQHYGDIEGGDLYSMDLQSGQTTLHNVRDLQSMAPYKDGQMIALHLDVQNMYNEDGEEQKPEFCLFNPKDDSTTPLGVYASNTEDSPYEVGSIYYDAQEDSLYTYTDTDLYRYDDGLKTRRLVGHLPMFGNFWATKMGGLLPLWDGRLAVTFGSNVYLRERTEKGLEGITVLTMGAGIDATHILVRALMDNDDIVLRHVDANQYGYIGPEELNLMFLTGSVPVDIMPMNAYQYDFGQLVAKGYLADLSGNDKIKAYMDKIAPNLTNTLMRDGKIYAVPAQLMLFPMGAYVSIFEKLNLTIPETFPQFIDLVEHWAADLQEEHTEYMLFGSSDARREMLRLAMDCYMDSRFGAGQDLTFDTPEFRDAMQRINDIPYGDMVMEFDYDSAEGQSQADDFYNRTPVLETGMGYEAEFMTAMNNRGERRSIPLILPFAEGQKAYAQCDLTMLTVMATSPHQEAAARLIASYIDKLPLTTHIALDLSVTGEIPNPDYESGLVFWQENLKNTEARYAEAQGAAKSNMESDLEYTRQSLADYQEDARCLYRQQDLDILHGMVSKLYVMTGLMNAQRHAFYNASLFDQYENGQLTLDQFIKQADDVLRLVRLEYQ